jgi:portal protein
MEREIDDVNEKTLSENELNEMEERRINMLNEAGIDEQDILKKCNEDLHTWTSYFQENITRGKDDVNFVYRDQWTAVERSEFTRLFKPCMTFNKLKDSTRKVLGEQRRNKPNLMVRSLTGKANQEQINLRQDLVRTISYQSQNDLVYQVAARSALTLGFGAFHVMLDYETPKSFNQVIKYDIINDPTMCAWDPTALKPHKGDGNWCSRRYLYTRDEFFATYPFVTNPVSYIDPYMLLDFQWTTRDTITVCDYFVKEWYPTIVYKLSNGMAMYDWEWEEFEKKIELQKKITSNAEVRAIIEREAPKIVTKRQSQDYNIRHYRLIRDQIIDFSDWPSRHLPIPFVDGDSVFIEGRQYTTSFIHEARDAQKLLNYSRSETAAELKNRRREQWIGTPDNIAGYEQDWRNPELQMAMLRAKPDPKTGQLPQKMPAWEISQGLFATSQAATQDIKEILGISENEIMQGRDISGKARRERKLESAMSSYVFQDNLNQAIEQGGRIVLDLLPYIAGEDERQMVVNKLDGRSEPVIINQRMEDGSISNQLDKGDYDIEIDSGPSFAVQKEVALEMFQQTIATYPQAFPLIADLWAKNMDVQFMPQIAERFKSIVPPQILAKEEGKEIRPTPPNPQEQMMQQELQLREQQIQERAAELAIRREKHELDKANLILEAHELNEKRKMTARKEHSDMSKADMDFTAKIAKILADTHKSL